VIETKSRSVFKQLFVCATASTPSLLFMYAYLNIPTKFFSICVFTEILFLIILIYVFNQKVYVNLKFNMLSPRILFLLIYVFCLLAVLLLPGMNESVFVSFDSLGMVNWLRALAGSLLGLFLPGYAIISLFRHKLNPVSLLPTSFLLSIFIESTVTFIAVMLAQPALTWILIVNILVFSLSLIDILRGKTDSCSFKCTQSVSIVLDNESVLMLLLSLFQLSILFSVFLLSGLTVPNGDMWRHAGMATRIEKGELLRFGYLTYPPFFATHLFSVSQLSGIPPINMSNMLGLANVLFVLAFYSLAMTLTKNRNVAFLSTFLFTIFGSFAFLVQAQFGEIVTDAQKLSDNFLQVAGKTMQINSVYPLACIYAYAPVTLHFLSVLVLTSLLLLRGKTCITYAIEALLIANLFLLHVAETMYVLIFLVAAFMLNLSNVRDTASLTFGVGFGGALLLVLPFVKSTIALYVVVAFMAVLTFTLIIAKLKLLTKLKLLFNKLFNKIPKTSVNAFLAFTILSFYGVLFYIWKTVYIDYDNTWYGILSYLGAAPTYFMPVAFGIPMLLSVLYFAKFLTSKDLFDKVEKKALTFLIFAFLLAFLFGKAMTLSNLSGYMIYRELRILQTFGGILFAMVSGYALHRVFRHCKKSKPVQKYVMAIGLGVLILLGSGSTLLSAVFWTNRGMEAYQLNSHEVEALEFLKKTVKASDVILAYSSESNNKVGLTGCTTIMRHITPFLSSSPSVAKFFLQYVDYIYLTKQEYATIQNSDTYMKSLISILPVIFNNSEVFIFRVPSNVKSFAGDSSLPVIITGALKESLQKLAVLDRLGISYHVYDNWDPTALTNSSIAILLDDVENKYQAKRYLDFMQNGGHLIVMGGQKGYFSDFMNIRSKMQIVFQESWPSEDSFKNWSFDLRGGLQMSNIYISRLHQFQERNSLLVNASVGGTLGLAHKRDWPKNFPFAIGTWFMLLENKSVIKHSLILSNALNVGVGLWDENYNLDYYYDRGKIIYDIAEISPGSWQKIELYFPEPKTCYVYLNDTLIFVGPRSTRYDPPETTYVGEYNYTIYTWFVRRFVALWNGLYYATSEAVSADGLLFDGYYIPLSFDFKTSAKESFDKNVRIISWLTFKNQKVSPFIYAKNVSGGSLTYMDFTLPPEAIIQLTDSSNILLKMLDPLLLNYTKEDVGIKDFPIEIYGYQNLNGDISMDSNAIYLFTPNNAKYKVSVEFKNQTQLLSSITNLIVSSANHFTVSVNGPVTIQPLHDGYVVATIPEHREVTILFSNQEKESLANVFDESCLKCYDITTITINTNTTLTAIIRTPNIIVKGTIKFKGAFFNIPYDKVIGPGSGELTLEGKIQYNILFSDKGSARSFGDNIVLNGSYRYDYPTILEIELPSKFPLCENNVLILLAIQAYSAFIIYCLVKNCKHEK